MVKFSYRQFFRNWLFPEDPFVNQNRLLCVLGACLVMLLVSPSYLHATFKTSTTYSYPPVFFEPSDPGRYTESHLTIAWPGGYIDKYTMYGDIHRTNEVLGRALTDRVSYRSVVNELRTLGIILRDGLPLSIYWNVSDQDMETRASASYVYYENILWFFWLWPFLVAIPLGLFVHLLGSFVVACIRHIQDSRSKISI